MNIKMRKYFLLAIVTGFVFIGCQQVEDTNSTSNIKQLNKVTLTKKENELVAEQKTVIKPSVSANIDTTATNKIEKQIDKKQVLKPAPKPIKEKIAIKKKTEVKKPEEKLSTDLIKNTKTAAKKKKPKGPLPKLEFEYKSFQFGTVDEGDTVTHKFKFKNIGDAPAIISDASSSCGCTVPSYPTKPIKPGESGVIEVIFNTKGKLLEQKKSITLTANTEPKYNTLYLEGLVYRRPVEEQEEEEEEDEEKKGKSSKNKKNAKKDTLNLKQESTNTKDTFLKQNNKEQLISDSLKNKLTEDFKKPIKKKP